MRRSHRGFTLIELVIAMAVIGILASVAIPSMRNAQFRSRGTERQVILQAIFRAVDDLWTREGQLPLDLGGGASALNLLPEEPDATPPSSARRMWRLTSTGPLDHWNKLALSIEGAVYYRYGGTATAVPGNSRTYNLYADGDLDGDGRLNRWTKTWIWVGGVRQLLPGSNLPCADCSLAIETNPWDF